MTQTTTTNNLLLGEDDIDLANSFYSKPIIAPPLGIAFNIPQPFNKPQPQEDINDIKPEYSTGITYDEWKIREGIPDYSTTLPTPNSPELLKPIGTYSFDFGNSVLPEMPSFFSGLSLPGYTKKEGLEGTRIGGTY